jgi:hypothetical protein
MRTDRGPVAVPEREIVSLQERERSGEFDQLEFGLRTHTFQLGDHVIIIDGALANQRGEVSARLKASRVRVGNLSTIVPAANLQRANGEGT